MYVDLTQMPVGQRYEDRYGAYMDIFKVIAYTPRDTLVAVKEPPLTWVPLLNYLGVHIEGSQLYFEQDFNLSTVVTDPRLLTGFSRTMIEAFTCLRPELTDVLWKLDAQWVDAPRRGDYVEEREFIVTSNGSFHRKQVMQYLAELKTYTASKDKVLLVPCAADKPYPAPLHSAVLKMLPEDFYLANLTGVLGIVPQEFWPTMPLYDSGMPNEWRLVNVAREYFGRNYHQRVVVYADYYSLAIKEALDPLVLTGYVGQVEYVNEVRFYADYLNLLDPSLLANLQRTLQS